MISVLLFQLSSCSINSYQFKRVFENDNTKWISEDPYIYFIVDLSIEMYYFTAGEVNYNGELRSCRVVFANDGVNQVDVCIIKSAERRLDADPRIAEFIGYYTLSDDNMELTIEIEKEKDTIFNGKYDTITLYRTEIDEE